MTESAILEQLMTDDQPGFSPETARALLRLRFSPAAVEKMNELAAKNREGSLTAAEEEELSHYLRVGNFLNIVQEKARGVLAPR